MEKNKSLYCLDIACGAKPFPFADVLCDLNVRPVAERSMMQLVTDGKPFVLCNCYFLPFKDKAFDFTTTFYLLEHLSDPWRLVKELKRISNHGYLQSPSWFNELLYGEKVHIWTVHNRDSKLCVKLLNKKSRPPISFAFVFHRLYKFNVWKILHAILDETFHLFTVSYCF